MESSLVSQVPTNGSLQAGVYTTFDTNGLLKYITEVLSVTLDASQADLESPGSLLSKSRLGETKTRLARYANESQTAVYVQKDATVSGNDSSAGESECEFTACQNE